MDGTLDSVSMDRLKPANLLDAYGLSTAELNDFNISYFLTSKQHLTNQSHIFSNYR